MLSLFLSLRAVCLDWVSFLYLLSLFPFVAFSSQPLSFPPPPLKVRRGKTELPSFDSFPQCLVWHGLGWGKARSQKFRAGFLCVGRRTQTTWVAKWSSCASPEWRQVSTNALLSGNVCSVTSIPLIKPSAFPSVLLYVHCFCIIFIYSGYPVNISFINFVNMYWAASL